MFIPKKSLGQNFLLDKNICRKIVKLSNIENKEIIEIGPGTGQITDQILLLKPKKITLIEKDIKLYNLLNEKYKKKNNVIIFNYDALNFDYKKFSNIILYSNLPYNITSKMIMNLLKYENTFEEIILMVQKEFANKINYKKNIKNNKLKFLIESKNKFIFEFNISNKVFYPKPKVDSSIIRLIPKNNNNLEFIKLNLFANNIFKFKRKKISNILRNIEIKKNLIHLLNYRSEDISTKNLLKLFNSI